MTHAVPELAELPAGLVLDGELVAWADGQPYFPAVCHRVLNRDLSIPLTYVVFDVLRTDREDIRSAPYSERRLDLEREAMVRSRELRMRSRGRGRPQRTAGYVRGQTVLASPSPDTCSFPRPPARRNRLDGWFEIRLTRRG